MRYLSNAAIFFIVTITTLGRKTVANIFAILLLQLSQDPDLSDGVNRFCIKSQLKHIRDEQMTDGKVISIAECLHVTLAKNRYRLIITCCWPITSFLTMTH